MTRILIIEDDETMLTGLEDNLKLEGYEVTLARDGERGLTLVREKRPELIILDIMLPKLNGYEVCKTLRAEKIAIPIIMLTAKGQEVDKILGLELGADDYITKPFSLRELLARVKAILRRVREKRDGDLETYAFGPFRFNFKRYEAYKKGKKIELTPLGFKIMKFLIKQRGEVISRFDLLDRVWGYDNYPSTRTVDNHIVYLRKIIEPDPRNPIYIISIRGVGYKFIA